MAGAGRNWMGNHQGRVNRECNKFSMFILFKNKYTLFSYYWEGMMIWSSSQVSGTMSGPEGHQGWVKSDRTRVIGGSLVRGQTGDYVAANRTT